MNYIDVFNGDADGICSLVQLRRNEPREAELVTGVKRDIKLLKKISEAQAVDTSITVLDISLEKNSDDVKRLLDAGAEIDYSDHHKTGDLFKHPNLTTDINLSANVCTALIVDKRLQGKYRAWAITAAFGDNLTAVATELSAESGFDEQQTALMQELGILINYNGYGADLSDLYFEPAKLFKILSPYDTPFDFINDNPKVFEALETGYEEDMEHAFQAPRIHESAQSAVIELPDEAWARRVSGVFGNELANQSPDRAHAVIKKNADGTTYLVSVRAPLNNKQGADTIVSQFPTGGGRKAAAGINALPESMLSEFIQALDSHYA